MAYPSQFYSFSALLETNQQTKRDYSKLFFGILAIFCIMTFAAWNCVVTLFQAPTWQMLDLPTWLNVILLGSSLWIFDHLRKNLDTVQLFYGSHTCFVHENLHVLNAMLKENDDRAISLMIRMTRYFNNSTEPKTNKHDDLVRETNETINYLRIDPYIKAKA